MKQTYTFLLLLFLAVGNTAIAQEGTIIGRITNADGAPWSLLT